MSLIAVICFEKRHKQMFLRDLLLLARVMAVSLTEKREPHVMMISNLNQERYV